MMSLLLQEQKKQGDDSALASAPLASENA